MKIKFKSILKLIRNIIVGFIVLLLIFTLIDQISFLRLQNKAKVIQIGDKKEDIILILGEPVGFYQKGSGIFIKREYEQICYGKAFDWKNPFLNEFPFFYPVKIRYFGPVDGDIVFVLDNEGKVKEIISNY